MILRFAIVLSLLVTSAASLAHATSICDVAATEAAPRHGVPLDVMRAITRVETGHRRDGEFTPWPWTTNVLGRGAWHDSRSEAYQAIRAAQANGHNSIDIGCFQINLRWHGEAFSGIEEMLDPHRNADYAARFLSDLHSEFGSWERAVGAFHSRTERYASRYRAKYSEIYAALPPMTRVAEANASPRPTHSRQAQALLSDTTRENRYPLLQNENQENTTRRPGSLMPGNIGTSPLF